MNIRQGVEKLINLKNPGPVPGLLLTPLTFCSLMVGLGVRVRQAFYRFGLLKSHRPACKVIAVGNITVGGTGKTPTVCRLAGLYKKEGTRVVVVNRGYRGTAAQTPQIVSDGRTVLASFESAGDEACMLAKKLPGIPVIAGRDRVAAAALAIKEFGARVVLLDDGFQHFRISRDLDVVLVNARNPFGNGHLLPRGILREAPAALQRSRLLLVTHSDATPDETERLKRRLSALSPGAEIFTAAFKPVEFFSPGQNAALKPGSLAGKTAVALCSIGDPDSFFSLLEKLKVAISSRIAFPDHHIYRAQDYRQLDRLAEDADCLITTEKDIAKLDLNMLQRHKFKLLVAVIEQQINSEARFFSRVKALSGTY